MADTKITGLTADASPSSDDLIITVNDPGGVPANRKVTLANLEAFFTIANMSDAAIYVTLTGTETLTNKTLTSPVLTTPQINDTSADHQYIFAGSELVADRTVTLPLLTGNDEFVFKDHAVTLTNKTMDLASNTLTGTTAQFNTALSDGDFATLAGTETLTNKTATALTVDGAGLTLGTGAGADAVLTEGGVDVNSASAETWNVQNSGAGAMTLQADGVAVPTISSTSTLTNKTFDLASNTLTGTTAEFNTALSDGSFATLAGTETLTGKTLTSPVLTTPQINDASADHQYIFAGSELTLDRTVTLPLLTGNDTFVFEAHAQTLTQKTIDGDNNTISNLAHGAEVDNPSSGVHGVTGSVVGTSDSQTLTNKTLTDSTTLFQDEADNTKKLAFQLSGITTGTTRTLTAPDASGTVALTSDLSSYVPTSTQVIAGDGLSDGGALTSDVTLNLDIVGQTENASPANNDFVVVENNTGGTFRKVQLTNLPGGGGGLNNIVEDTTPQLGGMLDVNGNSLGDGTLELLSFSETVSAVNHPEITNAATANAPSIRAAGDDTNIDLIADGKGTGNLTDASGNRYLTTGDEGTGNGLDADTLDGNEGSAYALLSTLASTANGDGASLIGIEDSGAIIAATTVEGALAEIQGDLNAVEADYLTSSYAGSSNIVTTGALNSGSITSGFGNIDIGSSTFDTTGNVGTGQHTINSGAGTDAVLTEGGIDRSSGSTETFNVQNSGAGAMTLQVDGTAVAVSGGAFHDGFSDFVANEHVDHTSVTMTVAGTANEITSSAGAQDISASRTWTIGLADDAVIPGTGGVVIPVGTDAQRNATQGAVRYNTTGSNFEGYDGTAWQDLQGAGGGDAWSDPVDAVITPDADGTRDLGLTGTRFATAYFDDLEVTNTILAGNGTAGAPGLSFADDPDTGMWRVSTDHLGFAVGGVEAMRMLEGSSEVRVYYRSDVGITASATQTQGQQQLISSFNQVSTVTTTNDVVTLPGLGIVQPAAQWCTIVNDGANTLQIFPSANDDLGQGVNTSTTLAAGESITFIGIDNVNWAPIAKTEVGAGGGGDAWSDPVDAVITPDADGTRDLGATGTRFAHAYFDDLSVTNTINGSINGNAATVTTITGLAPDTATTQATQPNITTMAGLTSIQGLTVTLADAGADAFFGWDDTASAYENLTAAEAKAILGYPTSTTDNTVPRFNLTGGNIQTSGVSIDDSDGVSGVSSLTVDASGSVAFGAVTVLNDTAGSTELQNIDSLDATTEATIEGAIDTLANLTSIQGLTVTLADAGADAFLGWDDTAGAYENLTSAEATAILDAATESAAGTIEIATQAEINTGTDNTRAITPDGLAGSDFGVYYFQVELFELATDCATGDKAAKIHIPPALDGWDLVYAHAEVDTAGTTGTMDIQIHNVDNALDMLSTKLTVDSGETGSDTAATPYVINTSNDHVNTNDVIRFDIDAVHTTAAKGCLVTIGFRKP